MPQVTVAQAALLARKSRQTINKLTKQGDLAYSYNAEKAKVIDYAELHRMFPDLEKFENLEKLEAQGESPEDNSQGGEQLAVLKVQLDAALKECAMVKAEQERERNLYQGQIETLTKALEQGGQAMKLLADQSLQKAAEAEEVKMLKKATRRVIQENKFLREEVAKNTGGFMKWLRPTEKGHQPAAANSKARA